MENDEQNLKSAFRDFIRAQLEKISPAVRAVESIDLCERLKAQIPSAHTILFFAPLEDELDIWPVLEQSMALGTNCALPFFDTEKKTYGARLLDTLATDIVIGKSTHSLAQARAAEGEGADYIGFGPIFATPTKLDYAPIGLENVRRVHAEVNLPIFCIGGINIDNLQRVIDAGAKRVVMVSALLKAHNIVDYARCATDMLA